MTEFKCAAKPLDFRYSTNPNVKGLSNEILGILVKLLEVKVEDLKKFLTCPIQDIFTTKQIMRNSRQQ